MKYLSARLDTSGANEQIVIEWVDETNTRLPDEGSCTIDLTDIRTASAGHREMKARMFQWKDPDTCTKFQALFLMTDPEAVS